MIIAPISAIPSWEGFEYQRHIALYIALNHIWHEIELGNEEEVRLYKLGIEGEEDFSIIKGDEYISLHQVKEGAINLVLLDKNHAKCRMKEKYRRAVTIMLLNEKISIIRKMNNLTQESFAEE